MDGGRRAPRPKRRRPVPRGVARRRRRESGQSLIELVLVLPLLLLVLFGILEFANAWRVYQVITNSAREGARHAILPGSSQLTVEQAVNQRLQAGGLDPGKATLVLTVCSPGIGTCEVDDPDIVEITYPFQFRMIGPIAGLICGGCGDGYGSIDLRASTVMRNE